ncbi:metallophosphoesterase family protein [Humidisolicoccus flavus]|uniref:metallophosphoesterase family protein n=1 Tax=Humidisolicoccus flavus TaxID=3111414 RepID=UPI0032562349
MSGLQNATPAPRASPNFTLAHFTDTHLLAEGALLQGMYDTKAVFQSALERLEQTVSSLDAIVVSGDITDLGEPDAYRIAKELVEPVAERLGATIVWAAGNHDDRAALTAAFETSSSAMPYDRVVDVNGLRIIALDSSLEGWHHGGFDEGQAEWLETVLETPSPSGSLLVMHHPPVVARKALMRLLDFHDEQQLREILQQSDVRAILSGHTHSVTNATFAGIPVHIAGAISYVDDLGVDPELLVGLDETQSFGLVEIYDEAVVHHTIPAKQHAGVDSLPPHILEALAQMPYPERQAIFSKKRDS